VRLTRFGLHGVVFYGVMLLAFFAAPYSNLFFLLLAFLTLLFAVGTHAALRNLRGLEGRLDGIDPVPTAQPVRVPLRIDAPGRTRLQVRAVLELEGGERLHGVVDVLRTDAVVELSCGGLPRGVLAVRSAWLESVHPFGLVRVRRQVAPVPSELVVHPRPSAALEGRSSHEALAELLGGGEHSSGELQPTSLRERRDGDDVRAIHWRASARRDRLVVREWEGEGGHGLEVVLDRRCTPEALEEALCIVSAMVVLARRGKETLRVHSQGMRATFGEGQRPWAEALRFLAAARPLPSDGEAPPATSPRVARLPRGVAVP